MFRLLNRRAVATAGAFLGSGACLLASFSIEPEAHCQVPCGIYDDGGRIDGLKEDTTTIRKAMTQIQSLAGKSDAQSLNQMIRWVDTKEEHASNIIETVSTYFLVQKVKEVSKDDEHYAQYCEVLALHHAVLRNAMYTKQKVDLQAADDLLHSIEHLEVVYGK